MCSVIANASLAYKYGSGSVSVKKVSIKVTRKTQAWYQTTGGLEDLGNK